MTSSFGFQRRSENGPDPADLVRSQQVDVFLRKIVPHHAHQLDRREKTGRERNVCGRSAQHAVNFAVRRFHTVVRYRTHDNQRHPSDCTKAIHQETRDSALNTGFF